jgi:hypothetical protein
VQCRLSTKHRDSDLGPMKRLVGASKRNSGAPAVGRRKLRMDENTLSAVLLTAEA